MDYLIAIFLPPYSLYKTSGKISCAINIVLIFIFIPLAILQSVLTLYFKKNDITFTWDDLPVEIPNEYEPIKLSANGEYEELVVGESIYKKNLLQICGEKTIKSKSIHKTAIVFHEKYNEHDANACLVTIDGKTVGHLSRARAKSVVSRLNALNIPLETTMEIPALIVGGWSNPKSKSYGDFGVRLDMPRKIPAN